MRAKAFIWKKQWEGRVDRVRWCPVGVLGVKAERCCSSISKLLEARSRAFLSILSRPAAWACGLYGLGGKAAVLVAEMSAALPACPTCFEQQECSPWLGFLVPGAWGSPCTQEF